MLSGPLRLVSFVELSRGLFTARDIIDTERKILVALNYVVNPPTSRRFVGELLRILALTHGCESAPSSSSRHTSCPSLLPSRRSVLSGVLSSACSQIERASSVPALSLGTGPSVVAYAAFLNAVEDEFDSARASAASSSSSPPSRPGDEAMEDAAAVAAAERARLEDYQRHYRRYSRGSAPRDGPGRDGAGEEAAGSFLDAWKAHFLVEVYHASECYLSPDDQGILDVREMLLDECIEGAGGEVASASAAAASPSSSPARGRSAPEVKGKRSPRSPRLVSSFGAGAAASGRPSSRHFRGSSFFAGQQQQAQHSRQGSAASASLFSPYESDGRLSSASSALVPPEPSPPPSGRCVPSAYTRQASLPARGAGGRCTPDVTGWGRCGADPATAPRRTMEFEQQPTAEGWEGGRPAFFSA